MGVKFFYLRILILHLQIEKKSNMKKKIGKKSSNKSFLLSAEEKESENKDSSSTKDSQNERINVIKQLIQTHGQENSESSGSKKFLTYSGLLMLLMEFLSNHHGVITIMTTNILIK